MVKKKAPINFKLVKITTEQFALLGDNPKDNDDVKVNISLKLGLADKDDHVGVFVQVRFDDVEKPILLVEVGCHFEIEHSDWNSFLDENNDGNVILPKGFASHLVMITLGTLRGILHARTENTPFNVMMIPLINVTEMINSDITLKNLSQEVSS